MRSTLRAPAEVARLANSLVSDPESLLLKKSSPTLAWKSPARDLVEVLLAAVTSRSPDESAS